MYKVLKMTFSSRAPCWPWKLERFFTTLWFPLLPSRRVYIEETLLLSTISFNFKFLVLEDWLQTVQVRVTADAIWPVCLEIRILCEHERGSWNDERVFIFERSLYYCGVSAVFFFATLISYFPGANKYPSSNDAAQSTTLQLSSFALTQRLNSLRKQIFHPWTLFN